jgi:beta-galactosidase
VNRRDFLKVSGSAAAVSRLGKSATLATLPSKQNKRVLPINRGWRFSPHAVEAAHAAEFDDASFERVTLPHTNVRLPWHSFDDKDYEFVSTYRRVLKIPNYARGQRVFIDFEGVMAASSVWLNDVLLGTYRGGYTPFSFELTQDLRSNGPNVITVEVDSTERKDIPPFGGDIDYLTFGGIYREVSLRIVPQVFLENIHARPVNVLDPRPTVELTCFLDRGIESGKHKYALQGELVDEGKVLSSCTKMLPGIEQVQGGLSGKLTLEDLGEITLWDLRNPKLYQVRVRLLRDGVAIDEDARRIGFREAVFTEQGFSLNGKIVKLHGLNRHQTFPYVGGAMPARVQRKDAIILRYDMRCNIVRTSHYPQSRHFLDCCDEIGLLVLEEIPGWQHVGDAAWMDLAVDNVRRMIRRDWNHPSIVLWGVRVNESKDYHDFYTRTNAVAHELDAGRQTGGVRYLYDSELLEDVFTMNDFGWPMKAPNHPLYLNTEFVGHTFPTKTFDSLERLREHTVRHARVHDQLASSPLYAGGLGWCAFDYNTHYQFGSGDRVCYHGVMDIFRTAKPAAGFYKSMCEPDEEIVLEPAFHWAHNDESIGFTVALISSNCDHLKLFIDHGEGRGYQLAGEGGPDRKQFPNLRHAPFSIDIKDHLFGWGDLRIDGFLDGKRVVSKSYSGDGIDKQFQLLPDDTALIADGADMTRIVFRVSDQFGRVRPFATAALRFQLEGPAELIGDNPFPLVGGTGALWIRSKEQPGTARLQATHSLLGSKTIEIEVHAAELELA